MNYDFLRCDRKINGRSVGGKKNLCVLKFERRHDSTDVIDSRSSCNEFGSATESLLTTRFAGRRDAWV